jgi:cobalt-zinc-cadmium efflux system membrane fusion protein
MNRDFPRVVIVRVMMIAAFAVWPVLAGCGEADDHGHDEPAHEDQETEVHSQRDDETDEHDHVEDAGEHSGHDAGIETSDMEDAEHEGHGHEDDGHDEEGTMLLSPEAIKLAGIRIETVQHRSLERKIELPGEIGFNEDRLVHVTPRYAGVAHEVLGRIGAYVAEGEVLAVIESNESLARYKIVAPISGRIIEKHLTVGEFVAEDHDLFLIADLSTVWANCEVYAKDMPHIEQGMTVTISAVDGGQSTEALLSYVAPVYSEDTRSALARVVLANNGDIWRPGAFIRAIVPVETGDRRLTVKKEAVQIFGDESVVFVPAETEGRFEPVPVCTGTSGEHHVEILSGLNPGDPYVAAGAFELKAEMVTANLDPHAGHGH